MKNKINISDIKAELGGSNEPKDQILINLLKDAYSGKVLVRVAEIKVEGIKPFSSYKPKISNEFRSYFDNRLKDGNPPPIYVYPLNDNFIMSDDYNSYYLYLEKNFLKIICVVLGEAKNEFVIECSEPFKLPPPTVLDISDKSK